MEGDIPKSTKCIEPDYGSVNEDGYVRVLDKPRSQGGRLVMKHRMEWEKVNGPIPQGHEINHLCKNRRCCNVEHLECLTISEHKTKDNKIRYRSRIIKILKYKQDNPRATQKEIAEVFGITQSGVHAIYRRENIEWH